jgi:hypothetical protein
MSWKMTKEVREARLAGQLPGIKSPVEFLVLFVMADTCRGESRVASISVTELVTLSDVDRTTIWRAIKKLGDLGYVRKLGRGNQFQSARFDVLPEARCTDATCPESEARCADATCAEEEHVANEEEHVAPEEEHVANEGRARCTGATLPSIPDITIPINHPTGEGQVSNAREADPPDQSHIDVHVINGGSSGTGNLSAGVCAISSNGANGHMPARIVPGTDLVVADMDDPDALYVRLGFVRSASEPTFGGITPPSRYCVKHQPSGIDGNCWGCGNARIYHDKTWPGTREGMKYRTYQAAGDELVKQEGRALGRDLRRQAMVEKLSRNPDAAMFGFSPDSFNPDSAVDQKMADWLSLKDRPGEAIEGEIA